MPPYEFKCRNCNVTYIVVRTVDPHNDLVPQYNPEEPCPVCAKKMQRVFEPPLIKGETCVKEQ